MDENRKCKWRLNTTASHCDVPHFIRHIFPFHLTSTYLALLHPTISWHIKIPPITPSSIISLHAIHTFLWGYLGFYFTNSPHIVQSPFQPPRSFTQQGPLECLLSSLRKQCVFLFLVRIFLWTTPADWWFVWVFTDHTLAHPLNCMGKWPACPPSVAPGHWTRVLSTRPYQPCADWSLSCAHRILWLCTISFGAQTGVPKGRWSCNVLRMQASPYMPWFNWHTRQGCGGSFKDRKPKGEVGCCQSWMAKRTHWWLERWLECRAMYLFIYLSIFLCIYLSVFYLICLSICLFFYLSICLSIYLFNHRSIFCLCVYLSFYLSIYVSVLSICLSPYLTICLSVYLFIYPSLYLSIFLSIFLI